MFLIPATGESYYRAAISHIAKNEPGTSALVFCTARLVLEDLNPHDANAVAIHIDSAKVGHLSRDTAVAFRQALGDAVGAARETTCDAVILKGLVADGKSYEYAIELDLTLKGDPPALAIPPYFEVSRQMADPPLKPRGVGLFEVTVWLPLEALSDMDKKQRVESWTTDHWATVNYYFRNRQGIGLGHRALAIPKDTHARLFGAEEPEVSLVATSGRKATLLFKRT